MFKVSGLEAMDTSCKTGKYHQTEGSIVPWQPPSTGTSCTTADLISLRPWNLTRTLFLPRDQGLPLIRVYVCVHVYECEQMCAHNLVPWMEEYICASPHSFEMLVSTQNVNKSYEKQKVKFIRFVASYIWPYFKFWIHSTWIHLKILNSILQTHLYHM